MKTDERFERAAKEVTERFHRLYYSAYAVDQTWASTFWLGTRVLKCPLDLWLYQEILHETRPDVVIETGTAFGGSALYLASILDLLGKGRVVTVDLEPVPNRPVHPRIDYVAGSSVAPEVVARVKALTRPSDKVLVILDSDHRAPHVLEELRTYGPLVSKGSYLIVEDTNLNGRPVRPEHGPGPAEAIETYLKEGAPFEADRSREKFYLTFNPGGYLRRR